MEVVGYPGSYSGDSTWRARRKRLVRQLAKSEPWEEPGWRCSGMPRPQATENGISLQAGMGCSRCSDVEQCPMESVPATGEGTAFEAKQEAIE